VSNGSTTPTVSSVRSSDRIADNGADIHKPRKKRIGLNAARHGISRRIQQLASARAEELDLLDEDLRQLQVTVAKTETLQTEASKLELEIRQKEEELWALKRRHRRVLDELADTENSTEAKLSSYKTSLSLLDREVSSFLAHPPNINHVPLSSTSFLSLPVKRRTLEMAREFWQDEFARLAETCEELDADRGALDEGAMVWNDVVKKVAHYEASLQSFMQQTGRTNAPEPTKLLEQMESTITYLEEKLETASSRSWNLLVCAIGAELEAFTQGKTVLEEALGVKRKGKEKATNNFLDHDTLELEHKEQMTGSAIKISHSPPEPFLAKPKLFDTDDEDPDPELMISHQYTDTD
jgi:hypothetical protein